MNKLDKVELDNGLTIYLYNDLRRHSTFFQFVTKFGGLYKDFSLDGVEYHLQDGVAHILEHYMCECNDSGNFLKILGEKQMNTNASTHYDMTRYYFNTVENVSYGIETILNGIYNIDFTEEKLEKLKNPIFQEVRGKSDSKFYHSNIMCFDNLFNNIKFRTIGGSVEDVKKTTIDDVKACYDAFYQPNNQVIVIAGNFDKEAVLKQIKDFYSKLKFKKHDVKLLNPIESNNINKKSDILYYPTPLDYVELSFKVNISELSPKERLDLDFFLGCFFNNFFGVCSKLYQEFIDKKIITTRISCNDTKVEDYLVISIGAYTHDEEYFKKRVLEVINNLNEFDQESFELDKKSCILRMILRDENITMMIMPFVDNLITFNYPYLDTVDDIDKLSYEDYINTIKNIDFTKYTIVTIKNKEKES